MKKRTTRPLRRLLCILLTALLTVGMAPPEASSAAVPDGAQAVIPDDALPSTQPSPESISGQPAYHDPAIGAADPFPEDDPSLSGQMTTPRPDLEILSLDASDTDRRDGVQPFSITIQNNGLAASTDAKIRFYQGTDLIGTANFGDTIAPGETKTATHKLPIGVPNGKTTYSVTVSDGNATDTDKNKAEITLGLPDIAVEVKEDHSQDPQVLFVKVRNLTDQSTAAQITIREDSADGTLLEIRPIEALAPHDEYTFSYRIPRAQREVPPGENRSLYVSASAEGEISLTDNTSLIAVPLSESRAADVSPKEMSRSAAAVQLGTARSLRSTADHRQVTLQIASVDGAEGYIIYRSLKKDSGFKKIGATRTTTYTDDQVIPGKTYYYKAAACAKVSGTTHKGPASDPLAVRPVPAPPLSMSLSPVDHESVTLSITTSSQVPQCEIYRSTDPKKGYERIASVQTGYYQDRGLTLGKTYHYKSRSYIVVSGARVYSRSTKSYAYTPKLTAPTNAAADPDGSDRIRITWDKTSGASGYEVSRASKSAGPYKTLSAVKGLSYVDTRAGTDICRYYKVRPYYMAGKKKIYGPASHSLSAKAHFAPPVIQGLSYPSYTSLRLSWRQMHDGTATEVSCADSPYGAYRVLTSTAKGTYTHTGLEPGRTYYYKLRTYKLVNGEKVYTDYSQTSGQTSLATVTGVRAVPAGINRVKLRWDAAPKATIYYIYHSEKQGSGYSLRGKTTKTTFTDTNLLTGDQYFYIVKAFRILDGCYAYGADSEPVLVIPGLLRPSSVTCRAVSKKALKLSWKKNSEAAGYEIWGSKKQGSGYKKIAMTNKTTFISSRLAADRTYHYKIRAYATVNTERIYSPWSSIAKGKTKKK